MIDRDKALALLHEYTKNPSLIKHGLSVEAAMVWYANHFNVPEAEKESWAITGLIHDFDYEKYPEPNPEEKTGHPFEGAKILKEMNCPESIITAVLGHALYTNTPRNTQMAKTLFAVDELSGLITASVLVRPDKSIHTIEAKSVKKKMKDKAFARGCNRDEIKLGAEELRIDLTEHITNIIMAMRAIAKELELDGS